MSIIIIGDVHGKWDEYQSLLMTIPGPSIQIGDMGMGFGGRKTLRLPPNAKWFRGNHDNPAMCREHPNYLGDYGYLPEDKLFYMAGAFSIDYMWRVPGKSWWADEELSSSELLTVAERYVEARPRFVVSHEAPKDAAVWLLTAITGGFRPEKLACSMSRTAEAMQWMFDQHQPEEWVFGHYHINKSFDWKGTKFTCVNELSTYGLETT